jgi:hypothetical protein
LRSPNPSKDDLRPEKTRIRDSEVGEKAPNSQRGGLGPEFPSFSYSFDIRYSFLFFQLDIFFSLSE